MYRVTVPESDVSVTMWSATHSTDPLDGRTSLPSRTSSCTTDASNASNILTMRSAISESIDSSILSSDESMTAIADARITAPHTHRMALDIVNSIIRSR